ncbi:MAG: phosphoribosyltransferase family protein [Actinomycetota bacterium]
MSRFANLADAGEQLVPLVGERVNEWTQPRILAIMPNGVPVAEPLADALSIPLIPAPLDRAGDPAAGVLPALDGCTAVVVDDGVETGTAARLVGEAARAAGAVHVVLAVPVCPREAQPTTKRVYDEVIALDQPLVRRDLRWHYVDFDTIDEAEARRRLDAR